MSEDTKQATDIQHGCWVIVEHRPDGGDDQILLPHVGHVVATLDELTNEMRIETFPDQQAASDRADELCEYNETTLTEIVKLVPHWGEGDPPITAAGEGVGDE